MIIEVIVKEEDKAEAEAARMSTHVLPCLQSIELEDLPNLKGMCLAKNDFEWPLLESLDIEKCQEMMIFTSGCSSTPKLKKARINSIEYSMENDLNTILLCAKHKIAFTSLEHLEISEMNSKELWSNEIPDWCFQKFRKIRLSYCPKLLVVFTSHFVQRLNDLEELCLSECDSLEVVFDLKELIVGGEGQKVVFINRLGTLRLSYLTEMKHVWKNCPRGFEGFQSLTILEIYKCQSLKYLFSPLIARVLVNLRLLEIRDCELLEEVVSERDEGADEEKTDEMIFFPMLDKLLLKSLPRLGRLGTRAYAFGRPSSKAPAIGPSETQNQEKRGDLTASAALEGIAQHQLPPWALGKPKYMEVSACHNLLEVVSSNLILAVPQLEEMKLDFLENLMYIGRVEHCRVLSFENLKNLSINCCNKLSYLFSSSIVKSLVQLTDLCVSHCTIIEVIVKEEDEAEAEAARMSTHVLPCLQSIKLGGLPNLKGMCLGKNDFEWPLLELLDIEKCQEMMIFTSGCSSTPKLKTARINSIKYSMESDLDTILLCAQQKIPFTSSENLKIQNIELMKLMIDQLPTQLFSNVRRMEVSDCCNLVTIFSSRLMEMLYHLQELEISNCGALEVLFDLEEVIIGGEHKSVPLNQLKVVRLSSLGGMKHVWKNWCHGFEGFQSLTTLQVHQCQSLGYLFSSLMAKDLVNLRFLDVDGCKMMEMVVSKKDGDEDQENQAEMIFFPMLHKLKLGNLPNILCFGPGPGASDNRLSMGTTCAGSTEKHHAGNVSTLFSCPSSSKKTTLHSMEHKISMLTGLDELYMYDLPSMTHIWRKAPQGFVGFQSLTRIEVCRCQSLRYLFSPSIAKVLVKLQMLQISDCGVMEEVLSKIDDKGNDEEKVPNMIFFPRIGKVELHLLPKLQCICNEAFVSQGMLLRATDILSSERHQEGSINPSISSSNFNEKLPLTVPESSKSSDTSERLNRTLNVLQCHELLYLFPSNAVVILQNFKILSIKNCNALKAIIEGGDQKDIDGGHVVMVSQLEELELESLPKLTHIWRNKQLCGYGFPDLKKIDIFSCRSLTYLFCSSTLKSLVQLKELYISGCGMMEAIVKEDDEVEETETDKMSGVVLPCLESVRLKNLPKLGGMCLGKFNIGCPSLKLFDIHDCQEMMTFTSGHSTTPNLESVCINSRYFSVEGDLSTTLMTAQKRMLRLKFKDGEESKEESVP